MRMQSKLTLILLCAGLLGAGTVGGIAYWNLTRDFTQSLIDSDVVARYGGEEFVMLFPEPPAEQAAQLCESLRAWIAEHPWQEIADGLSVTLSIGVCSDLHAGSAEWMIAHTDEQLYLA